MKRLFLSLFVMIMFVSASYAQTKASDELEYIKKAGDPVIEPLGDINAELIERIRVILEAKQKNGFYHSSSMNIDFIVEYGVSSCPYGYTKYSMDRKTNYGCETVEEFTANVEKGYYVRLKSRSNDFEGERLERRDALLIHRP